MDQDAGIKPSLWLQPGRDPEGTRGQVPKEPSAALAIKLLLTRSRVGVQGWSGEALQESPPHPEHVPGPQCPQADTAPPAHLLTRCHPTGRNQDCSKGTTLCQGRAKGFGSSASLPAQPSRASLVSPHKHCNHKTRGTFLHIPSSPASARTQGSQISQSLAARH